jgi:hypothetical protein
MLKDDLTYLTAQTWRAIPFELFGDVEAVRVQPILALGVSLYRVHVHRFVALVGIEIQSPALHI